LSYSESVRGNGVHRVGRCTIRGVLLERQEILDRLRNLVIETRRGQGRLVLLSGEAGIGKTSVAEELVTRLPMGTHAYWGACDVVSPPRPFASLVDIAARAPGLLSKALADADRDRVFDAFLGLVRHGPGRSRVIVLDDLHWADEATLDLLRVVGPRLASASALLIGTYRDHEVGLRHPLRLALGDIPSEVVINIQIPPLSSSAVATLAHGTLIDAGALYDVTGGNPFFVTEVIAAYGTTLPVTVRDAVLARMTRLSTDAQAVITAAAVLGPTAEVQFVIGLANTLANTNESAIDQCVTSGILHREDEALVFRHELARRSVLETLSATEAQNLNKRALAVLRSSSRAVDPNRLAHHAHEAADVEAVLEFAPVAASRASALGAHRQAREHLEAVLAHGKLLNLQDRARLRQAHSHECAILGDIENARTSQAEALEIWAQLGDISAQADGLSALSFIDWLAGDGDRATDVARRAVALIEPIEPETAIHARAHAVLAQRIFVAGGDESGRAYAEKAFILAEQLGEEAIAVHSLTTLGATNLYLGEEMGWQQLEQAVARARQARLDEDVTRALINLLEVAVDLWRLDAADRYAEEAMEWLADRHLDLFKALLAGRLAELALRRGRWAQAEQISRELLERSRTASQVRARALTVLGRLAARRGDNDPWPLLDEAQSLIGAGEIQDLRPIKAARIEAAWIAEEPAIIRAEAEAAFVLIKGPQNDWATSELAMWLWKAGALRDPAPTLARPALLHVTGGFALAAAEWEQAGCPYYQALALADQDTLPGLRAALQLLHRLGATKVADGVAERLRQRGATDLPRGPRASTRRNPFGLTDREMEILALLGDGLRNGQIAERLVLSPKTVGHHVEAVLRKLDVPSRIAAAEIALSLHRKDGDRAAAR